MRSESMDGIWRRRAARQGTIGRVLGGMVVVLFLLGPAIVACQGPRDGDADLGASEAAAGSGLQDAAAIPADGRARLRPPWGPTGPPWDRTGLPDFAGSFAQGAVACDHPDASEAGAAMLRAGGNAVDAAVAASFALSVVRPDSCGIGGGGFMVIHAPGSGGAAPTRAALDYRETAPAAVGGDYYVTLRDRTGRTDASRVGVHASGVPGTVAGLLQAHRRYGRLPRSTVLEPAIRLAEDGWRADAHHVASVRALAGGVRDGTASDDDRWVVTTFGGPDVAVGDALRNPAKARGLRLIAERGADAFYRGPIAGAIERVMTSRGGTITADDLAAYRVRAMTPLVGTYRGQTVLTMPPPSSGGLAILQTLGLLERFDARHGSIPRVPADVAPIDAAGAPLPTWNRPRAAHRLVEALKHAFADRAEWLADPDYVDVPVAALLDPAYLDGLVARFDPDRTLPSDAYGSAAPPPMDGGTSHLSVVDADGMAVACTETINFGFGSRVPVAEFGFLLNNEMDDFTTIPGEANGFGLVQSDRNLPQPGKRPLSSMSPTIVLDANGEVRLVVGASGGPRIITGTLQVLLAVLDDDADAATAVARPRLHHQWLPDVVGYESDWSAATGVEPPSAALAGRGHRVEPRGDVGNVQVVIVRDGVRQAASDPRKGGRPAGH